ncbi:hypothetical protein [Spongiactinospora sp. TRM90649]|uniref:hypothetical protein n=1 Tax=Spongiactinospora sp. TRM90649 TaxID=3031114 RepID=UPI0023F802AB|nr:hypothetical protein [Spongiactinospora sp. TRM90649]MDF5752952.1 hypothetical protein [Spongiactinospora sp. TRM90649]
MRAIAAGAVLLAPPITHRLIETYADRHRAATTSRARLSGLTARRPESCASSRTA